METTEFQLVSKEDLERIWKSSRRNRLKVQEDRIWEHFCKEQDIIKDICHDTYVKELRDIKHLKIKQAQNTTDAGDTTHELEKTLKASVINDQHSNGDCMPQNIAEGYPIKTVEMIVEEEPIHEETLDASNETNMECENSDMVKTEFDHGDAVCLHRELDNDDGIPQDLSGGREAVDQNCSECSPHNQEFHLELSANDQMVMTPAETPVHVSTSPTKKKPPEKVDSISSRLRSSIYCTKLKNIRTKINDTLNAIIQSLNSVDIELYSEKLAKIQKYSKEFCNRFNRVYIYQLQQQLQSVKRNNAIKLPFGKHTQFQAQIVRMESLHHNILQALQVFHKSFEQTHCIGENVDQLRNLLQLLRDTLTECAAIACPAGVAELKDVHSDVILLSCENVDAALFNHAMKTEQAVIHIDESKSNRREKIFNQPQDKSRTKLKISQSKLALGSGSGGDSRLSMYSFNTFKVNLTPKIKHLKGDPYRSTVPTQMRSSRTALPQRNLGCTRRNNTPISKQDNQDTSQVDRKISNKLPLMKDTQRGRPKKRIQKERDIKTMVEQVDASPARTSKERKDRYSSRHGGSMQRSTSVTSLKSLLGSTTTKSTSPRVEKTSTSFDAVENASSGIRTEDPNKHSDRCFDKVPENTSKTDMISPTKRRNEVAEEPFKVSQQQDKVSEGDSTCVKRIHVNGSPNVQLVICVSDATSPTTKLPFDQVSQPSALEDQQRPVYPEKYRLKLEPDEDMVTRWAQHRAHFLQHMLTSHMYTNSSIHQPWHVVGRISEKIIDDALVKCARELQIQDKILQIYQTETGTC